MVVQITTGFLLKPIKKRKNMILCEYVKSNCLYKKGAISWFYESDLREANIFDI